MKVPTFIVGGDAADMTVRVGGVTAAKMNGILSVLSRF